jgi:hypothetical protein
MNGPFHGLAQRPVRIHVLGALLTLTCLAALAGGTLLLMDPSGAMLGLTAADLGKAPFQDYTIPGAVLVALFGLAPIPVLVGLWKTRRWARELAGMLGAALAIWILAQVVWSGVTSPVQPVVWVEAVVLLAFGGAPAWSRDGA